MEEKVNENTGNKLWKFFTKISTDKPRKWGSFAKGLCERIGIDGSKMEYEVVAKDFEKKIRNSYAKSQRSIRISNISFNW